MSEDRVERARIFERERKYLGYTPEDYLRHLAKEADKTPEDVLTEVTGFSYQRYVSWYDLKHYDLYEREFDSFSHGDAALTLVRSQKLIDEIHSNVGHSDEETLPLIRELAGHGASQTLIGF